MQNIIHIEYHISNFYSTYSKDLKDLTECRSQFSCHMVF